MQLKGFFTKKKAQNQPQDTLETPEKKVEVVEETAEMPKEDQLTELHDQMSKQCIDYIF